MGNRGIIAGSVLDGTDWKLPAVVQSFGNGANTVTASAFSVLPTTTCSASITNPHPSARLLVMVTYGAWLIGNGATGDIRVCPNASGSLAISAGLSGGNGGAVGWGEVLYQTATGYNQRSATITYELPVSASAAVFDIYAYRNGAGTVKCDFPTLRIVPLRYLF
jgi:hypothetical protein